MADSSNNVSRIDNLKKRLQKRRNRTNLASTLTLIIGLVAVGLLSFYFYYGYQQFEDITDPKKVINIVQSVFDDNIVEVRSVAAKQIRDSAPQWAEELSNELIKQMPEARTELESQLRGFIQSKFQEAQGISQEKFREMIAQNRPEIQEAIDTVKSEKDTQAFIDSFMPIVEKSAGIDIENNAAESLGAFVELNERLDRLTKGENLSALEQQQRYVLGLVQRLRVEETDLK